ncbi:MAG: THUMP domain-containing protein, partial [Methanobacterium sp.]
MEIIFILSGEHVKLPKAEITASLEALNASFSSIYDHDRVLILDIPDEELEVIETLGKRLAYTNEICRLLFETDNVSLKDDVKNFEWEKVISNDYAVRVKKIGIDPDFNSQAMEIEIGGIIKDSLGEKAKVNLENPEKFLRIIITEDKALKPKMFRVSKAFISERLIKRNKKHYYDLKPHKRPFFYPGSMSPKLARGMNNLSRIKKGSI